ncbi:MAG TPA: hypothetical protein PKL97_02810 [Candidatus Omnitrophota bacterium]|nr:hypothetical protein [Candidatus Omnitrophota bacterium]
MKSIPFRKVLCLSVYGAFLFFCLASLVFPSPLLAKKSDKDKTSEKSFLSKPAEESSSESSPSSGDFLDMASGKALPKPATPKIVSVAPPVTFVKPQAAAGAPKASGQLPPVSWNPNPPGALNPVRVNPVTPVAPVMKETPPAPSETPAPENLKEKQSASDDGSEYEEDTDETLDYMEEETEESRAESNQ